MVQDPIDLLTQRVDALEAAVAALTTRMDNTEAADATASSEIAAVQVGLDAINATLAAEAAPKAPTRVLGG